jgi:hypothetical protein
MKNQYVGDVKDFYKYKLLRLLTKEMKIAVCWMLTPNNKSGNGNLTWYLEDPEYYSNCDYILFDKLKCLVEKDKRDVTYVEKDELIPNTKYYGSKLPEGEFTRKREIRKQYFINLKSFAEQNNCDLIFFDPDKGLQTPAQKYKETCSEEHLYWNELNQFSDYSVLVFQHYPRYPKPNKEQDLIIKAEVASKQTNRIVWAIPTKDVAFLLFPSKEHQEFCRDLCEKSSKICKHLPVAFMVPCSEKDITTPNPLF